MSILFTLLMAWGLSNYIPDSVVSGEVMVISEDIDLAGQTMELPADVVMVFKGGVIRNGTVIGNGTRIDCRSEAFENVSITGTWNVPEIHSSWFRDLKGVNSLQNVFALTSSDIMNKVYIYEGDYPVAVYQASASCIEISSNTDVILYGTITMRSNHYSGCNVVGISGHDITLSGTGTIIGDKDNHLGDKGEWGMGIKISGSDNVTISGVTVKDCWGDCVYIGNDSRNVVVEDCILDNGRRQGISITAADNVRVSDVLIKNVGGTSPGYAIDVEPNRDEWVDNVLIERMTAIDCEGGIFSTGHAINAYVGDIKIRDCIIKNTKKMPVRLEKCCSASILRCSISNYPTLTAIRCNYVDTVDIRNNTINDINKSAADKAYAFEGKRHIQVFYVKSRIVSDNSIF